MRLVLFVGGRARVAIGICGMLMMPLAFVPAAVTVLVTATGVVFLAFVLFLFLFFHFFFL